MDKIEMICINCPLGCPLTAEKTENGYKISGNTCPRGEQYAINELTAPKRTLTTTLKVSNREGKFLPVKTKTPISKGKLFEAMEILSSYDVKAPVKVGDVVFANLLGESDIVAAGEIK